MNTRRLSALVFLGFSLLMVTGVQARAASSAAYQTPEETQTYTLELTLLPNYRGGTVDVVGQFQDTSCADVQLEWFQQAEKVLLNETTSADEVRCAFQIRRFGGVRPEGSTYRIRLPRLTLPEGSTLRFMSPSADVLASAMEPAPDEGFGLLWELSGPIQDLEIPIHPWQIKTTLTLIPIAFDDLVTSLGIQVAMSGEAEVSGIQDLRVYESYVERSDLVAPPTPDELLALQLDYPPLHYSDSYPGIMDLAPFLSSQLATRPFSVFQMPRLNPFSTIVAPVASETTEGSFAFRFLGVQRYNQQGDPVETLCPVRRVTLKARMISLCVRLGPHDTLTLQLPGWRPTRISPPPNDPVTLTYRGPSEFPITFEYDNLSSIELEQFPVFFRGKIVPLETELQNIGGLQHLPKLLVALVLFAGLIAIRMPTFRVIRGNPSLWSWLDPLLWVVGGIMLLCWTPSVANLSLLSILIIAPQIDFRQRGEPFVLGLFIATAVVEDVLFILNPAIGNAVQHLTHLTPVVMTAQLVILIIGYRRLTRVRNLPLKPTHFVAFASFLIVLATYETIARSLLSLVVIVATLLVVRWRAERLNLALPAPGAAAVPPHPLDNLRDILNNPLFYGGVGLLTLQAISESRTGIIFTMLAIMATAILFTALFDVLPTRWGFTKAFFLPLPLSLIFLIGFGTANITLQGQAEYAFFINSLDAQFIERFIFYLCGPLCIGFYMDWQRQPGQVSNILSTARALASLASVLMPTLAALFINNPSFVKLADAIERFVAFLSST